MESVKRQEETRIDIIGQKRDQNPLPSTEEIEEETISSGNGSETRTAEDKIEQGTEEEEDLREKRT